MRDVHDAGRLLRFALTPKLRPSQQPAYAELVERLRTHAPFEATFRTLLEGMGLILLAADEYGVVLGCQEEGPFAMQLGDFRSGMKRADRLVYGLLQLAIAAWCFPRAEDLSASDAGLKRVPIRLFTGWLIDLCEQLEAECERDPEVGSPELREAWREVLRRAEARQTATGRRGAGSLSGMVQYSLELLEKQGLMRQDSDDEGGTWKTTRAYRIQVRELAANQAFTLLRSMKHAAGSGEAP